MPVIEDFLDLLSAALVVIIISVVITIAWMSTYVRNQPFVTTAVVVFQQETLTNLATNMQGTSSNTETSTPEVRGSTSQNVSPSGEGDLNASTSILGGDKPTKDSESSKCQDSVAKESENKDTESKKCSEFTSSESDVKLIQVKKETKTSAVEEPKESNAPGKETGSSCEDVPVEVKTQEEPTLEVEAEAEAEIQLENLPRETIRIKLKFLDDTQRLVRGQLTDEVGSFKRANFNSELSSNRVVRLIFNGQLLNRDTRTLGQYGLFDNCVVHCHISQPQQPNASDRPENLNHEADGLDISDVLSPLLIVIVAFLWYLRYEYSHIFNTSATIILVCLTALLIVSQYALTVSFNISFGYDNGNNSGSSSSNSSRLSRSATQVEAIEPSPSLSGAPPPSLTETQREENPSSGPTNPPARENNTDPLRRRNVPHNSSPSNPSVSREDSSFTSPVPTSNAVLLNS